MYLRLLYLFFFFKQKTAYELRISDWSSDGCSSDRAWMPAWSQPVSLGLAAPLPTVSGTDITLRIAQHTMVIDGRQSAAIGVNGTVPAPLIRLREGQMVRLNVINDLDEDSSIHWH